MSENTAAPATPATPETPQGQAPETPGETPPQETFDKEYVDKLRKEAAKYRTEAKAATSEAEKVRQASMSEAEKAVAEAEQRGRQTAVTEFGKRLARTEFDAAAARRNPDVDTAAVLEYVDLARFVGDDGEPDPKAIAAAVERLVPTSTVTVAPSFDGGARSNAPAPASMNNLIRKAAGRA